MGDQMATKKRILIVDHFSVVSGLERMPNRPPDPKAAGPAVSAIICDGTKSPNSEPISRAYLYFRDDKAPDYQFVDYNNRNWLVIYYPECLLAPTIAAFNGAEAIYAYEFFDEDGSYGYADFHTSKRLVACPSRNTMPLPVEANHDLILGDFEPTKIP